LKDATRKIMKQSTMAGYWLGSKRGKDSFANSLEKRVEVALP
jgi:hypothetical protein